MKQNAMQKLRGAEGFASYYSELFGDRWQNLKASLSASADYVEWKGGGLESYYLDSASVRAALSLPLENAENILDLCAAPGGKTLVLASLMPENARLTSNERSFDRKKRLDRTIESCLSPEIQSRVSTSCSDGATLCKKAENLESFDRILLDAPCSSERHVLADPKYLADWSPSRIKTLAMQQWALLSSAWRMLASGGFLLYSTCALNPAENDGVVSRLLKKFPQAQVLPPKLPENSLYSDFYSKKLPEGEKTEFGVHVLPDSACGAGPLYFCLLKKI